MSTHQHLTFLHRFILNPRQVGSVIPSSKFLANKMLQYVPWHEATAIAELGAGTGAMTRFIHTQAEAGTKVLLFEMDKQMRQDLQRSYSNFTCHANACHLTHAMKQHGISQLDCIISGLPFFNFTPEVREALLQQAALALKPGGYFLAFQYSLQMKKLLSKFFIIEKVDFTALNFPPAFVYVCRKKGSVTDEL